MATLYEDTNPRSLPELLGELHNGATVLPDFQRDYVWDPSAVDELIVSIVSSYPAGSILRVRSAGDDFAWRPFEGAKPPVGGKPTFMVLDGQQRLTSLYQAFYGHGDFAFFLDVGKLLSGEPIEDALHHSRRDRRPARTLLPRDNSENEAKRALAAQAAALVIPLGTIRASQDAFNTWCIAVTGLLAGQASPDLPQLLAIGSRWIKPIQEYKFPVVTLSQETTADAVCTIFETLNRTGIKLSPFELLTARYFARGVRLRDLWEQSQTDFPDLLDYDVDPYAILQAITLRVSNPATIQRRALMDLTADQVRQMWPTTAAAMASGLSLLRDECGVMLAKWLPYSTMLAPLAAVIGERPLQAGPAAGARRQKLVKWFWCASLSQLYESSANRKAELDYVGLVAWLDGGEAPASVSKYLANIDFETVTPRQRALYSALMCLVLSDGARDFHTGKRMTSALIKSELVDDHHIFPLGFLGELNRRTPDPKFDNILNRTLIDATTNRTILANGPAQYLATIDAEQGSEQVDATLISHGIDEDGIKALRANEFDGFKANRRKHILRRIAAVTGVAAIDPPQGQTSGLDNIG